MKSIMVLLAFLALATTMQAQQMDERKNVYYKTAEKSKLNIANDAWKKVLTPKVYNIMREKGTEMANSGPYVHNEKVGTYHCAACGNPLFLSGTKFDSHTGWPSFFEPLSKNSLLDAKDNTYGMDREEVMCSRCGGHLGHVFDDGPPPTHLRYCINGYALNFTADK